MILLMIFPATLNVCNVPFEVEISVTILTQLWSNVNFSLDKKLNLNTEDLDVKLPHKGIQNVYLISGGEDNYKIGYGNVQARLKALQTGNANTLNIVCCCPGGQQLETHLHNKFSSKFIRGEWYKLDQDDVENIITFMRIKRLEFIAYENRINDQIFIPRTKITDNLHEDSTSIKEESPVSITINQEAFLIINEGVSVASSEETFIINEGVSVVSSEEPPIINEGVSVNRIEEASIISIKGVSVVGSEEGFILEEGVSVVSSEEGFILEEGVSVVSSEEPPIINEGVSVVNSEESSIINEGVSVVSSEEPSVTNEGVSVVSSEESSIINEGVSVVSSEEPSVTNNGVSFVGSEEPSVTNEGVSVVRSEEPCIINEGVSVVRSEEPSIINEGVFVVRSEEPSIINEGVFVVRSEEPSIINEGVSIISSEKPSFIDEGVFGNRIAEPSISSSEETSIINQVFSVNRIEEASIISIEGVSVVSSEESSIISDEAVPDVGNTQESFVIGNAETPIIRNHESLVITAVSEVSGTLIKGHEIKNFNLLIPTHQELHSIKRRKSTMKDLYGDLEINYLLGFLAGGFAFLGCDFYATILWKPETNTIDYDHLAASYLSKGPYTAKTFAIYCEIFEVLILRKWRKSLWRISIGFVHIQDIIFLAISSPKYQTSDVLFLTE